MLSCSQGETLKVIFLGTSAAEWYPTPWCKCKHCVSARLHGGRDVRAYSSIVVVPDVLVDMPPDVVTSAHSHGVDLTKIKTILITHPHSDHLNPRLLLMRRPPSELDEKLVGPRVTDVDEVLVCASQRTLEVLKSSLPFSLNELKIKLLQLKTFAWVELRTGLRVLPLPANHMTRVGGALIYVIEKNGKRLLYAVDIGPLGEDVMKTLQATHLDLVICEATVSLLSPSSPIEHMSLETAKELREKLIAMGTITLRTPFVLTHISPHWFPPYHEVAEKLEREGLTLAYDGMEIEV